MHRTAVWALVSLGVGSACGGSGLGKPIAQFPTRGELEQLGPEPAAPSPRMKIASVEHWQLQLEPPAADHAYPEQAFWDRGLKGELARTKSARRASQELHCAASEVARFFTENGAFPDDGLRSYVVARCGSALSHVGLTTVDFEAADTLSDADLESGSQKTLKELLGRVEGGQGVVGLGFARGHGRASFVLLQGNSRASLESFSPLVEGDSFVLSGHLEDEADSAMALVTQGKYAVASCDPDYGVAYPAFKFTCPMAKEDTEAVVEVATRRPERVLAEPVLHVLMRRSDGAGLEYTGTPSAPATSATAFPAALLTALNQTRSAAKVRSLELEPRQSVVNQKVAPHFLAASFAGDDHLSNLVALGVLAGWDVNGVIRGGGVYSGMASTEDATSWLNRALESPLGRWTLLDPETSKIAIGTARIAPSGVMALVTTYAFFESNDHSTDEDAMFEELRKQRGDRHLTEPLRRQRGKEMTAALQHIASHEQTSGEALQEVVNLSSAAYGAPLQGWVVETSDLSLVRMDGSLLAEGNLAVEVGVTHYKAPGGAWGQYVVLLLFTGAKEDDGGRRAQTQPLPLGAASAPRRF